MNQVVLVGRLVRDVDLKQSNVTVGKFSIAVNRQYKKDNEKNVDFINCVTFGKTAEFVSNYFKKGSMIAVSGRLQTGNYEKDGKKVYTTDVIVNECCFVGSKQEPKGAFEGGSDGMTVLDNDDELPF